jgi:hypothetical protein
MRRTRTSPGIRTMRTTCRFARGHASWRRGRPGFHVHADYYEMERVMLPLARDGATVDMILAITVYFDRSGNQAA